VPPAVQGASYESAKYQPTPPHTPPTLQESYKTWRAPRGETHTHWEEGACVGGIPRVKRRGPKSRLPQVSQSRLFFIFVFIYFFTCDRSRSMPHSTHHSSAASMA
jgi:hypothetical protein